MAKTIRSRNFIKLHESEQFFSQASLPDVKVGHKKTNCAGSRIGVAKVAYRAGYQSLNLDTGASIGMDKGLDKYLHPYISVWL